MKLFISYAHKDHHDVEAIDRLLRRSGHQPWFDHALLPGQDWKQQLLQAILECDVFVYAMTQRSIDSEWCQWEFQQAVKHSKPIMPVLLDADTRVPSTLSSIQYANFSQGMTADAVAQFMTGIHTLAQIVPVSELEETIDDPQGIPAQAEQPSQTQSMSMPKSRSPWRYIAVLVVIGLAGIGLLTSGALGSPSATEEPDVIATSTDTPTATPTFTSQPTVTYTPTKKPSETTTDAPTFIPTTKPSNTPRPEPTVTLALSASEYTSQGLDLYDEQDYEGAIALYTQAIAVDPNYENAYVNRGLAYKNLGEYEQAIVNYDRALELNSNLAIAYTNRGAVYINLGKYEQAIADSDRALDLDPDYANAYINRGLAYKNLGEYEQAIANFEQALELDSNLVLAYSNRGTVYNRLGDYDQAITDYNKALDLDPDYANAYINRGLAYANLGGYDQAIADYNKAIDLEPNDALAYMNLGSIYYDFEDFDRALASYETYLELAGDEASQTVIDRVEELRNR